MSTITRRPRRTADDWMALAKEKLPEIKAGKRPEDFPEVGSNGDQMRTALARLGYSPEGNRIKLQKVQGSPKVRARVIARRRRAGTPWWQVLAETDDSYGEIHEMFAQYGFSSRGEPINGNGSNKNGNNS